jgi:hypothetical protein
MDHHRVETWVIEGQPDVGDPDGEMRAHLAGCLACRQFAAQWTAVHTILTASTLAQPRAGFKARWLARLEVDRRRSYRRQVVVSAGVAAAGCVVSFGLLATWILSAPATAFAAILTALFNLESQLQIVSDTVAVIFGAFPPYSSIGLITVSAAAGMAILVGYVGFGALWAASLYQAVLHTRNGGKLQ